MLHGVSPTQCLQLCGDIIASPISTRPTPYLLPILIHVTDKVYCFWKMNEWIIKYIRWDFSTCCLAPSYPWLNYKSYSMKRKVIFEMSVHYLYFNLQSNMKNLTLHCLRRTNRIFYKYQSWLKEQVRIRRRQNW